MKVIDKNSNIHHTLDELSRGGQGIVYKTSDPEIAIKIEINSMSGEHIKEDEKTNNKIDALRLLPIPRGINITLPISTLNEYSGYVMRLLNDMIPFEKAFTFNGEMKYPSEWIKDLAVDNEEIAKIFAEYLLTGGAKARFRAYLKVACYLAKLHSKGLVYCDISDNNMFVSKDLKLNNVWLIDADNINFQKNTLKNGYYTNGYGAPEIAQVKSGCTFYSDCYAFMVSFFYQISQTHPFKGAKVEQNQDDSWDTNWDDDFTENNEQKAFNGEFPWILDKEDSSNERDTQIMIESFCSGKIIELFDKMFCKEGRENMYKRPSMYQIADQISNELNNIINCSCCKMEYNYLLNENCPYCDNEEKNIIKVTSYYYENNSKGKKVKEAIISQVGDVYLDIITNNTVKDSDKIAFSISCNGKLVIKKELSSAVNNQKTGEKIIGKYQTNEKEVLFVVDHNEESVLVEFKVIK